MRSQDRCIVLINPFRINPNEGAAEYLVRVISSIAKDHSKSKLLLITPMNYNPLQSAEEVIHFTPFGGLGIVFLEANISYWISIIKLMRRLKATCDNRTILIHNFHFGSIGSLILSKLLKAQLVYIAHDVEIDRYSQYAVSVHELKVVPALRLLTKIYEFFATRSNLVISISRNDKRRLSDLYSIPAERLMVVAPYISNLKPSAQKKDTEKSTIQIVFHGSYKYLPNKEAVEIIKDYIARRMPYKNVRFIVFGSGSPKLRDKNFVSIGFVDDIYEFLSSCDIAIVPLKRGAGVKLKMLDYMVVGLPIVTTKKGAEGLELVNGKHAIIVDDVNEEFVKTIEYLIENPKMRRKLGHNGRILYKKYHTQA